MSASDRMLAPPDIDGALGSKAWLPRRYARTAISAAIEFCSLANIQPEGRLANPYGHGDARDSRRYHLAVNILLTAVRASYDTVTGDKDIAGKFALIAAREFKYMLDWQAPGTLFSPARGGADARKSKAYERACALFDEALPHVLQSPVCDNAASTHTVTIRCVIPDGAANTPSDVIKLSTYIETSLLSLGLKLLNKDSRGSKDGGLLEFSISGCGQVDKSSESVNRQFNAVHDAASDEVVGRTLCHGADQVDLLMEATFGPARAREKRSEVYMCGVRAFLEFRATGAALACPYDTGTLEFDAYFAGLDEGREIWRSQMRKEPA